MDNPKEHLIESILKFMTVLYDCYKNTTYANDRSIYAEDIAVAMGWVVEIRNDTELSEVIEDIFSRQTNKYFTDYWRQGEWGMNQNKAFKELKVSIEENTQK